jgi:hypothetical protein
MTVGEMIEALQAHDSDQQVLYWDAHGDLRPIRVVLAEVGVVIRGAVQPGYPDDDGAFPIVAISDRLDLPPT